MNRSLHSALLFVVAAAGASGCTTRHENLRPQSMLSCNHAALENNGRNTGPAIVSDAYATVSDVPLNAVTVLDDRVFRSVMVQSLYSERLPAGTVHATARIANCTDGRLVLRARTSFLRTTHAPAEPASAWKTVYLEPRGLAVYEEISLAAADVGSYLIELDWSR